MVLYSMLLNDVTISVVLAWSIRPSSLALTISLIRGKIGVGGILRVRIVHSVVSIGV